LAVLLVVADETRRAVPVSIAARAAHGQFTIIFPALGVAQQHGVGPGGPVFVTGFGAAALEAFFEDDVLEDQVLTSRGAITIVGAGGILNAVVLNAEFVSIVLLIFLRRAFHQDTDLVLDRELIIWPMSLPIVQGEIADTGCPGHDLPKGIGLDGLTKFLGLAVFSGITGHRIALGFFAGHFDGPAEQDGRFTGTPVLIRLETIRHAEAPEFVRHIELTIGVVSELLLTVSVLSTADLFVAHHDGGSLVEAAAKCFLEKVRDVLVFRRRANGATWDSNTAPIVIAGILGQLGAGWVTLRSGRSVRAAVEKPAVTAAGKAAGLRRVTFLTGVALPVATEHRCVAGDGACIGARVGWGDRRSALIPFLIEDITAPGLIELGGQATCSERKEQTKDKAVVHIVRGRLQSRSMLFA
tara:strand:- start:861 stop:2096 length:1236 start_codon:yes stop_codon:yes gene_type:complete